MPTTTAPKVPVAIVLGASCVLGGCFALCLCASAMIAIVWDPCNVIPGLIAIGLFGRLARTQYRAVRRRSVSAALFSSAFSGLLGASVLATAITLAQTEVDGIVDHRWEPVAAAIGAALLVGVVPNALWAITLRKPEYVSSEVDVEQENRTEARIRNVSLIMIAVAVCVQFMLLPRKCGEHVTIAQAPFGLPKAASDITFCQGPRGRLTCDFRIEEAAFVAWVKAGIGVPKDRAAAISLEPITDSYTILKNCTGDPKHFVEEQPLGPWCKHTIQDGMSYEWTEEDRGVHAAFDRTEMRAYYDRHYY